MKISQICSHDYNTRNINNRDSTYKVGNIYDITFDDHTSTSIAWTSFVDSTNNTLRVITDKTLIWSMFENTYDCTFITLSEMNVKCQKELALYMGEDFPWDESFWKTKERFEDYISKLNKKKKSEENAERVARKKHAQYCAAMARKYGIKFEISLRCFKGNERTIKNFATTLKNVIGKEFNSHELQCGRTRRRAEIARLGIDIGHVDPNYIAPYILSCLEAGKILV